jgi:hypothetical protein
MFQKADPPPYFYYGNDSVVHDPANCEGGDILVIGNGAVMVGMGERTTPQGIEFLARQYFSHGTVTKLIAVELPKTRAFMHLDTAMTMIDRDAFTVYPFLPDTLRSFTLTPVGTGGDYKVVENAELFPVVAEAIGVEKLRVLRTPIDILGAQREQWDDGNNFLAVAPGVIFGYERNVTTNTSYTRTASRSSRSPVKRSGAAAAGHGACPARSNATQSRCPLSTQQRSARGHDGGEPEAPRLSQELDFTGGDAVPARPVGDLKRAKYAGTGVQRMRGKNVALIFEKTSTRQMRLRGRLHDQGTCDVPRPRLLADRAPEPPVTRPACCRGCSARSSSAARPGPSEGNSPRAPTSRSTTG